MTAEDAQSALETRIAETLCTGVPSEIDEIAEALMKRPGARAVLFYGAALREPEAAIAPGAGPLDFYLLTDPSGVGVLGRLLPPHVIFVPRGPNGAKVAVMTLTAFGRRMRRAGIDTTLWARFSQPTRLLRSRDRETTDAVHAAIAEGVQTARWWTAHLVDGAGDDALADWAGLFRHTYGAELRVERGANRAAAVTDADPSWFEGMATLAPLPPTTDCDRARAQRAWRLRRVVGKLLNIARLAKAAFTYSGGIAYALAKVERHSGREVTLTTWQRRWPAL
ncbi:MAG: hypothetical protein AAF565_05395, partial [Pseudomonadota bacterium]